MYHQTAHKRLEATEAHARTIPDWTEYMDKTKLRVCMKRIGEQTRMTNALEYTSVATATITTTQTT